MMAMDSTPRELAADGALAGTPSAVLRITTTMLAAWSGSPIQKRYPIFLMLGIVQVIPARITIAAPMSTKHALTPIASANRVDATSPTGMAQLQTAP